MNTLLTIMMILVLLAVVKILLTDKIVSTGKNEWIVLKQIKLMHELRGSMGKWDTESPIILEVVPVFGWKYKHNQQLPVPVTPPLYHVLDRLNVNTLNINTKYETCAHYLRDGLSFDIGDFDYSEFWNDLYDYALAGCEIRMRGGIPDYYKDKINDILKISEYEHCKKLANRGNIECQYRLGIMYAHGTKVQAEYVKKYPVNAYMWLSLAATHGKCERRSENV